MYNEEDKESILKDKAILYCSLTVQLVSFKIVDFRTQKTLFSSRTMPLDLFSLFAKSLDKGTQLFCNVLTKGYKINCFYGTGHFKYTTLFC